MNLMEAEALKSRKTPHLPTEVAHDAALGPHPLLMHVCKYVTYYTILYTCFEADNPRT